MPAKRSEEWINLKLIRLSGENELLRFLGIDTVEATARRVVLTMEVTPKVHQYIGIMNGGVSLYSCETAASIGVVAGVDLKNTCRSASR